ncbi:MAG: hypothetical protein U9N14_01815 [Pseudomonadota bacterium]|nr:hypothetical protein [Pseudomonadota bacterium]
MEVLKTKLVSGLSRGQLRLIGVFLFLLGVGQATGSWFLIDAVMQKRDKVAENPSFDINRCVSAIQRGNFSEMTIKSEKGKVIVEKNKFANVALLLGEASAVSLMCPGYELAAFCMGEGCVKSNPRGLRLELQPK